jgi:hypothetical protein
VKWPPRPWLIAVAVALVGCLVFTPAITGGWIYDDKILIADNQYVHSFSAWPHWFLSNFWDVAGDGIRPPGQIAYWRPTVSATYALDWTLGGGAPTVFHVTNLLWQLLVGSLGFVVLRRWLGGALWPATLATLLFIVHPTKAESVAWISGRTDVICMAAMLLATQGVARRLRGQPGGVLLEAAGTLLAYTSKEQAIVLPMFVMIEAWVAAGRGSINGRGGIALLRVAMPQIILAVGYLLARKFLMPIKLDEASGGFTTLAHAKLVLETLGRFVTLTFVPHDLSVQQGLVQFAGGERIANPAYVALGAVALPVLIAAALFLRRRVPGATLGIGFFVVTLAPTLNIVNTQLYTIVSERFLYLPLFGLALAAGSLVAHRPHRVLSVVIALAIAALSIQSMRRASDFSDERTFWERELALHPDSGEARRARLRVAFFEKRYRAALLDALEMPKYNANRNFNVGIAFTVADLVARLTPDRDRKNLEAVDEFCRDMLERKQPEAVLRAKTLEFRIGTSSAQYEREMIEHRLPLLGLRSSLHSRLGDDKAALAFAQAAVDLCPRCESSLVPAVLALARGGAYDDASALLAQVGNQLHGGAALSAMLSTSRGQYELAQGTTGPDQLRARAAAFSALELWGRAFDVLEPYKDQIKLAPKFRVGFAELAYRAGEPQVAREVLASSMQPDEIERTLAGWARAMGWDEAPVHGSNASSSPR